MAVSTLPTSSTTTASNTSDNTNNSSSGRDVLSIIAEGLGDIISNSELGKLFSKVTTGISDLAGMLLGGSSDSSSTDDSNGDDSTDTDIQGNGDVASMLKIATSQVGTKATLYNKVKYNDWYYGKKNYSNPEAPWCAAFVSWVANQAGISTDVMAKSASSGASYDAILNKGGKAITDHNKAKPGDIIVFTNDGTRSSTYHIGIVSKNNNGAISTIEGNGGAGADYDRGEVTAVNYAKDSSTISKSIIARPKYAKGTNGDKPLSKYGQFRASIYGEGSKHGTPIVHETKNGHVILRRSSVDEAYNELVKSDNRASKRNKSGMGTRNVAVYGMGNKTPDYSKLINSIITILMTIADNTDKLNTIVSILNNKLNLNISASDVSNATSGDQSLKSKLATALNGVNSSTFNDYANSAKDSSINTIISAMNAIASE